MTRIKLHNSNSSHNPTWYLGSKYLGNERLFSLVKIDISYLFNKTPLNKPESIKEEA